MVRLQLIGFARLSTAVQLKLNDVEVVLMLLAGPFRVTEDGTDVSTVNVLVDEVLEFPALSAHVTFQVWTPSRKPETV